MKNKFNNKGFMMAEIIVVAVVIMIGLMGLFNMLMRLYLAYTERVNYDSVDSIYASKGLVKNYQTTLKNNLGNASYTRIDNITSVTENFAKSNFIMSSFLARYEKKSIIALYNGLINDDEIDDRFKKYINNFINSNDFSDSNEYDYIIFTQSADKCVNDNQKCYQNNIKYGYYKYKYNTTAGSTGETSKSITNVEIIERKIGEDKLGDFVIQATIFDKNNNVGINAFKYYIYDINNNLVLDGIISNFETVEGNDYSGTYQMHINGFEKGLGKGTEYNVKIVVKDNNGYLVESPNLTSLKLKYPIYIDTSKVKEGTRVLCNNKECDSISYEDDLFVSFSLEDSSKYENLKGSIKYYNDTASLKEYSGTDIKLTDLKKDISIETSATTKDIEPPVINNVKLVEDTRVYGDGNLGNYTVSWEGADAKSDISKFVVSIYNSSGKLQFTDEIADGSTYKKKYNGLTGDNPLSSGYYYATVYAVDSIGNSGESECSLDSSIHCGKSAQANIKYTLKYDVNDVSTSYSSFSMSNESNLVYGGSAKFTVGVGNESGYTYTFGSWSATYSDGTSIDIGDYDKNTPGTYTISNLTNDFKITVSSTRTANSGTGGTTGGTDTGSCLAEGTRILLANGKYKKIENIDYDDLLVVFDHENGNISYEYPAWFEEPGIRDKYTKVTFSDGNSIKFVNDHAVYSLDYNEYIRINDNSKFKVGSRIAKYKNNKLEEVKVTNIEIINEDIKFYHILSNKHFNIISNDIITVNKEILVSNFHGFDKNLKWKISTIDDVYSYDELSEIPYYMFRGLRLYEGKYFTNYGMNKDDYLQFLKRFILNEEKTVKPKLNENGKRQWMVTTSDDVVNEENKASYLMEEGDYYILKAPIRKNNKKFIGWLHTGENILYQPGDKVEVMYGTHFIAKYQDLFNNNLNTLRK